MRVFNDGLSRDENLHLENYRNDSLLNNIHRSSSRHLSDSLSGIILIFLIMIISYIVFQFVS
jgi:hypothetical protein